MTTIKVQDTIEIENVDEHYSAQVVPSGNGAVIKCKKTHIGKIAHVIIEKSDPRKKIADKLS